MRDIAPAAANGRALQSNSARTSGRSEGSAL
jgi:hypothetical protein